MHWNFSIVIFFFFFWLSDIRNGLLIFAFLQFFFILFYLRLIAFQIWIYFSKGWLTKMSVWDNFVRTYNENNRIASISAKNLPHYQKYSASPSCRLALYWSWRPFNSILSIWKLEWVLPRPSMTLNSKAKLLVSVPSHDWAKRQLIRRLFPNPCVFIKLALKK